jgi:hypothetical protein
MHPKGGEQKGWVATCRDHQNEGDATVCKRSLSVAGMSNEECCLRLKMWLLLGCKIKAEQQEGRTKHMKVNVKSMPLAAEEDLEEGMLQSLMQD